jgi:NAD(P)-dependent dehydrogenase (short-subunit alcohol dehydrogenase family)
MNNAGLPGISEPVELLSMDQLRIVFDVNYFGLVATTKAFLPLLRKGRGRIVNMSRSVSVCTMRLNG